MRCCASRRCDRSSAVGFITWEAAEEADSDDPEGAWAVASTPAGTAAGVTDLSLDAGSGAPSDSMTDAGRVVSGAKAAADAATAALAGEDGI